VGIQTGCVTNLSRFDSGNEEANALFSNNPYKSALLGVNFRYKISDKFSFQSGFHFTEFGFSYGMAKNYSLLKPESRYSDLASSTCISSIPALVVLNTPVNCNNVRFIFGAGFAIRGIDDKWESDSEAEIPANEGANAKTTYMKAQSKTVNGVSPAATWIIGFEKVLSRGNTMSFTFQGTQGFTTIAESTVSYTAGNQEYSHTFINRGSYATMAFAYNFSSFGTRKANKLLKNTIK
jgi:hypothetical protein